LNESASKISKLESSILELKAKAQRDATQSAMNLKKLESYRDKLRRFGTKSEDLEKKKATLEITLQKSEDRLMNLQNEYEDARSESRKLHNKVSKLESTIDELRGFRKRYEQLENDNDALGKNLKEALEASTKFESM